MIRHALDIFTSRQKHCVELKNVVGFSGFKDYIQQRIVHKFFPMEVIITSRCLTLRASREA